MSWENGNNRYFMSAYYVSGVIFKILYTSSHFIFRTNTRERFLLHFASKEAGI